MLNSLPPFKAAMAVKILCRVKRVMKFSVKKTKLCFYSFRFFKIIFLTGIC